MSHPDPAIIERMRNQVAEGATVAQVLAEFRRSLGIDELCHDHMLSVSLYFGRAFDLPLFDILQLGASVHMGNPSRSVAEIEALLLPRMQQFVQSHPLNQPKQ